MSYILDALRKADAERRGVPPPTGVTEPAVLVDTDPDDLPAARARPWAWVLGGVAIALAAAALWMLWRGGASPAATTVAAAQTDAPQAAPAPVPAPSPAPPAPRTEAPSADALPHFPPPLPDPPKQEPPTTEPPKAEPRPTSAQAPEVKPPLPPGIATVPAAQEAGTNRVYNVSELPENVRRDLPKFNVGGAMYSERAADRMVVLNGQVFHEGDALGKGIVLRQIRLKSTVLEFRGYRIEISH